MVGGAGGGRRREVEGLEGSGGWCLRQPGWRPVAVAGPDNICSGISVWCQSSGREVTGRVDRGPGKRGEFHIGHQSTARLSYQELKYKCDVQLSTCS